MSSSDSEPSRGSEAREHRRWLVGVGITLVFGTFGVVMALLSYWGRGRSAAPSTLTPTPSHDTAREPALRPRFRSDHRH